MGNGREILGCLVVNGEVKFRGSRCKLADEE